MMASKKVVVEIETVGNSFASLGVIYDARDQKRVGNGHLAPYGMNGAARESAESVAIMNGWTVVDDF